MQDNNKPIKRLLNLSLGFATAYAVLFSLLYIFQKQCLWNMFGTKYIRELDMSSVNPYIEPVYIVVRLAVLVIFICVCAYLKKQIGSSCDGKSAVMTASVFSGLSVLGLRLLPNLIASATTEKVNDIINNLQILSKYGVEHGSDFMYIYGLSNTCLNMIENYLGLLFVASVVLLITSAALLWYKNKFLSNVLLTDQIKE